MSNKLVAYTTFYASYHEAMEELSDLQYGRVARAINNYAFFGIEPDGLTKIEKIVFIMAKPTIDNSVSARRNGKTGGAPKGNQNAKRNKADTQSNAETTSKQFGKQPRNN